jgi:hypothetical protein
VLECRDMSDDADDADVAEAALLFVPVLARFSARVLMLRALTVAVAPAFILVVTLVVAVADVVVVLASAFLLCVGAFVCDCVCSHTLAESKGCPTRVPVIPAEYPAKIELRIDVEDHEVVVVAVELAVEVVAVESEAIVDDDIAVEGCIEVVAIVVSWRYRICIVKKECNR